MDIEESIGKVILVLFAVCFLMPPLLIYHGYVDMVLWQWFIVPLGLRPIGLAEAIGLGIAIQAIGAPKGFKQAEPKTILTGLLVSPILALAVGGVVRMFL